MPPNGKLTTYRRLSGEVIDRLGPVFAGLPASSGVAAAWSAVPPATDAVVAAVTSLGETVQTIAADLDLSDQGKVTRIDQAVSGATTAVGQANSVIADASKQILAALRGLAYPARPTPADAAQEAAIAGLKADLRMVWDNRQDIDALLDAMGRSLERAIADGDALATWLLATSRWPEDYLDSRGVTGANRWALKSSAILGAVGDADVAPARYAYVAASNPQRGLPVLAVLGSTTSAMIQRAASWRNSRSGEMVAPDREVLGNGLMTVRVSS